MGTVTTFDHTADVGLLVHGDDLNDLFRTAAEGAFDYVVANRDAVVARDVETITLHADSTMELLVVWLNELIFRSETKHRLYATFDVHVALDGLSLSANVAGEPIDRERHLLDHEVKAVTRHGLQLDRDDAGRWVAELILDI